MSTGQNSSRANSHTSGNWVVHKDKWGAQQWGLMANESDDRCAGGCLPQVCRVYTPPTDNDRGISVIARAEHLQGYSVEEDEAWKNAYLISAAPEMLAALIEVSRFNGLPPKARILVDAALAKCQNGGLS